MSNFLNDPKTLDTLDPEVLGPLGFIYIKVDDPLSWLISTTLKLKYDYIGFYYLNNLDSVSKYDIIIKHIILCSDPIWYEHQNLNDLIELPIIEKITVQPILFNLYVNSHPNNNQSNIDKRYDGIKYILMKVLDIIPKELSIISNLIFLKNREHPLYMREVLKEMIDKIILLYSPVLKNYDIIKSEFDEITYLNIKREIYNLSKPLLDKIGGHFIELLFSEPKIFNAITNYENSTSSVNLYETILYINNSIHDGYLNLITWRDFMNKLKIDVTAYGSDEPKLIISSPNSDDYDIFKETMRKFKTEINNIKDTALLTSNKHKNSLSLNDLIEIYNNIGKFISEEPIEPINDNFSFKMNILVKIETEHTIKYRRHRDGEVKVINSRYFNLDKLEREELIEILIALDNQIDADEYKVFENLKLKIIEKLS